MRHDDRPTTPEDGTRRDHDAARAAAGGLRRRAGHQPRRRAALRPRPRPLLAGGHRRVHRAEQGDRVQPGRRPDRPAAGARDRPHRAPDRPPGHHARARRRGRTPRSASRSTPTTSPRSPSTSPASSCCPGGARSPAARRRRPGAGRGARSPPLAGRAVDQASRARAAQVLGLTVGVPGLVDADGAVRLAAEPRLARRRPARRRSVRALREPGYDVAVDNDANLAVLAEYRYGAHAGTANLVYLTGAGRHRRRHHRRRPAAARRPRLQRRDSATSQVDPAGPPAACGRRGCLEAVAGIAAIIAPGAGRTATDDGADHRPRAAEVDEVVRRARRADRATLDRPAGRGRHARAAASRSSPICSTPRSSCSAATSCRWRRGCCRRPRPSCAAGAVAPGRGRLPARRVDPRRRRGRHRRRGPRPDDRRRRPTCRRRPRA